MNNNCCCEFYHLGRKEQCRCDVHRCAMSEAAKYPDGFLSEKEQETSEDLTNKY